MNVIAGMLVAKTGPQTDTGRHSRQCELDPKGKGSEQMEGEQTSERMNKQKKQGGSTEAENKQLGARAGETAGKRNNQAKSSQTMSKRQEQHLLSPSAVMPAWEKPRMAPKRLQLR